MTPDSSWSTRWSNICSFFSSSFWKSSIIRAASRRLRSNPSCFSRRASAVIRAPFFSSSSRSFSSSTRLLSISFCMTVFSRSSCPRAATPAHHPARTRPPSYTPTRPITQIRGIELGVEAVDVADVEERRDPQAERQRDHVLDGAEDLARPALLESSRVDRRNAPEFEGADRVRAAQVEALEQGDLLAAPAGLVAGLAPHPQDVAEPDRLEIGLEEARLVEVGVPPEAGEVEEEGGLCPLGRSRDHVPAVAGQGGADRGGDRGALLLDQVGRCGVAEMADDVPRESVSGMP